MTRTRSKKPEYVPTPAGIEILEALCEHGALTSLQLNMLLGYTLRYNEKGYPVVDRYCGERIQELVSNGCLQAVQREKRPAAGRQYVVHALSAKGKRVLSSALNRDELSCSTVDTGKIEHFLALNDFRITVQRAVADDPIGAQLITAYDEHTLRAMHQSDVFTYTIPPSPQWPEGRRVENVFIVPDYYIHLTTAQPKLLHHHRFVEIDLGSETIFSKSDYNDWFQKIRKYREYLKRDGLAQKRYDNFPLALLTVTSSEKRMLNLKAATEAAGGKHRFWFTYAKKLTPRSFFGEPIWMIAGKEGVHHFVEAGQ